jgi:hypothetical protein
MRNLRSSSHSWAFSNFCVLARLGLLFQDTTYWGTGVGGGKQQISTSHGSEGWNSMIKVQCGQVLVRALF